MEQARQRRELYRSIAESSGPATDPPRTADEYLQRMSPEEARSRLSVPTAPEQASASSANVPAARSPEGTDPRFAQDSRSRQSDAPGPAVASQAAGQAYAPPSVQPTQPPPRQAYGAHEEKRGLLSFLKRDREGGGLFRERGGLLRHRNQPRSGPEVQPQSGGPPWKGLGVPFFSSRGHEGGRTAAGPADPGLRWATRGGSSRRGLFGGGEYQWGGNDEDSPGLIKRLFGKDRAGEPALRQGEAGYPDRGAHRGPRGYAGGGAEGPSAGAGAGAQEGNPPSPPVPVSSAGGSVGSSSRIAPPPPPPAAGGSR